MPTPITACQQANLMEQSLTEPPSEKLAADATKENKELFQHWQMERLQASKRPMPLNLKANNGLVTGCGDWPQETKGKGSTEEYKRNRGISLVILDTCLIRKCNGNFLYPKNLHHKEILKEQKFVSFYQ